MIILIGASASGKTEVAKKLISKHSFSKVVTYTTRAIRPTEKDGIDYHFVSMEQFIKLREEGFFLETAEYNKNFYGTPLNDIALNKVLIVEPNGYKAIKKLNDNTIISFYITDTEDNRRRHMLERGDDPVKVEERILNDRKEFSFANIGTTNFVIDGGNKSITQLADEIYKKYINLLAKQSHN